MKFAKFLRTPFFKEFQWLLLRFTTGVSKEFGAKAGATVRNIHQIQLKKGYLLPQKSRSRHRRYSAKEDPQRPEQVF